MPRITTSPRGHLIEFIEQGAIPADKVDDALAATGLLPNKKAWQVFIDQLLLWLSGLALSFAMLFFIAYNWEELGRFAKFGMVQVFMLLAIAIYWMRSELIIGKVALLVASISLGVLLAFYGQTYQTGADPWQLFFNWALLMLPWALIARFSAIWILWLSLVNLTCILYYQTFDNLFGGLFGSLFSATAVLWSVFLLNTLALGCWELLSTKIYWLDQPWAIRIVAVGAGMPATWLALHAIFSRDASAWSGLVWAIFSAGIFFYYRKIKVDLFMLAGGCLSGIVVIASVVGNALLRSRGEAGDFLILALLIIGLSAGAAIWLGKINKEQQS